jgi:hypothetical protein
MRMQLTRDFYLPKETQGRTNIETITADDAVIYTYVTSRGQLGAMAFHGKAAKPDWHYSFANEASRARKIAEYIENRKEWSRTKADQKTKREAPHTLKVGQILSCSWGYDQTNVDYYQVTRVPGPHTVEIRQIAAASGPEEGFMTAYCTPVPDKFKGEPMIKRSNSTNCVRIASYACASPWDGKPDRYSWYA